MRCAAFLRAINVGGRRVTMDALRGHFEALGFDDVQTYLASGNVAFTAEPGDLEPRIEAHLEQALGYEAPTFCRTRDELVAALAADPFEAPGDGIKHYLVFQRTALDDDAAATLEALSGPVDTLVVRGRHVYWRRDMDAGESLATADLERAADVEMTRRTWRTVDRLLRKL